MSAVTWMAMILAGLVSSVSAVTITAIILLVIGQAGTLLYQKTQA